MCALKQGTLVDITRKPELIKVLTEHIRSREFSVLISVGVLTRHGNSDVFPAFPQPLETATVHTHSS
jgi:hypothetical protein